MDVFDGITPIDQTLASMLRRTRKPVLLVCNKADSEKRRLGSAEFARLGFEDLAEVSAVHGHGIDALVEMIADKLGLDEEDAEADEAAQQRRRTRP